MCARLRVMGKPKKRRDMCSRRTPECKVAFLSVLSLTCNIGEACDAIGVCRETVIGWRRYDAEFSKEWADAMQIGAEVLEDEAKRRAFKGVLEDVYHRGEVVGKTRKYSDALAMFILRGELPEKHRDRKSVELSGANGGPVELSKTERSAKISAILDAARRRKDEELRTGSDLI